MTDLAIVTDMSDLLNAIIFKASRLCIKGWNKTQVKIIGFQK